MDLWLEHDPSERYWCEITDRDDLGADLKCPQTDESGTEYWSYSLIQSVWPGDVVFHYATSQRSYVGASVAGGPLEERPIAWSPHGTVGRSKDEPRKPRPGWWLPLYHYPRSPQPRAVDTLQSDRPWIEEWVAKAQQSSKKLRAPIQLYPGKLRAAQGYLTKMPRAFVERWEPLGALGSALAATQDALVSLADCSGPQCGRNPPPAWRPAGKYWALAAGL